MCTHINGLICADRYIKLLLLNKVTYCYLLKSTASAILFILTLNDRHFRTSYLWHNFIVMQRLSSLRGKIALQWYCRGHKICALQRGQMYCVIYSECLHEQDVNSHLLNYPRPLTILLYVHICM